MMFVFYILAALLVWLSCKSLRGGIDYLNYFKSEFAKPDIGYTPFATVIMPFKGLDDGIEDNLAAMLMQNYPDYEVIFVVDDEKDPAVSVINELTGRVEAGTQVEGAAPRRLEGENIKLIVAPKAIDSSQKVENLREAVLHLHVESQVLVFVDSDARPSTDWLRHLVAPLADKSIGAATGYRWLISNEPTLAGELRSAWNASIASALGPDTKGNFCWGGSTAVRRNTFETLDIRGKWRGTLSDDFTVTRAVKSAGLGVYFVPQALTASIENCTLRQLVEFTNRQMKITRVYAPHLWRLSFFGSGLFNLVMAAAVFIIIAMPHQTDAMVAAAVIIVVSVLSICKAWLRINAVHLALPRYEKQLRKQFLPQVTLWAMVPAIFLLNCVAAVASRRIVWRGTTYEMVSADETRLMRPPDK